jgi:hypothetical protein
VKLAKHVDRRLIFAVVAVCGGAIVVGGALALPTILGNHDHGVRSDPARYTEVAPRTLHRLVTHRASASTPDGALQAILARVGKSAVVGGSIGGPPAGFQPVEDSSTPVPESFKTGVWAYLRVEVPAARGPEAIKALWEADEIAGALRDDLNALGMPPLYSDVVTGELPDGSTFHLGGGMGDAALGQVFSDDSEAAIASRLTARLNATDVKLVSVDVFPALQAAPVVVARTANPREVARNPGPTLQEVFGDPTQYEGTYLEIRDSTDTPAVIFASSLRGAVGHTWYRPDVNPHTGPAVPASAAR